MLPPRPHLTLTTSQGAPRGVFNIEIWGTPALEVSDKILGSERGRGRVQMGWEELGGPWASRVSARGHRHQG